MTTSFTIIFTYSIMFVSNSLKYFSPLCFISGVPALFVAAWAVVRATLADAR